MITLVPEVCYLNDLLIGALNAVYSKATGKNITIVHATEVEKFHDITVKADPKWTIEAIVNVFDNAIKYSPNDSTIKVKILRLVNFARIEIHDEGIGITKNEYSQIYKRFYRGENSLVKAAEGSGVGLYLTRRILEKQGGGIWASSKSRSSQTGTIFYIQLRL